MLAGQSASASTCSQPAAPAAGSGAGSMGFMGNSVSRGSVRARSSSCLRFWARAGMAAVITPLTPLTTGDEKPAKPWCRWAAARIWHTMPVLWSAAS
nr:hypothetical protein [uncultured Oscillibacter sp.]